MDPHPFDGIDLRQHPEAYRIGRGEYGVFHAQPYKSELLPLWRFRTPAIAEESAAAIYARFCTYRDADDFVGMDVARKYLQMGFTRARRYANHRGGRKYGDDGAELPRSPEDSEKAAAAAIFARYRQLVLDDPAYQQARAAWKHTG